MTFHKRVQSPINVYLAAKARISYVFDNFPKIYVSFSAGKDSTVMLHLLMEEAVKRNRKIGLLLVDLEAQYTLTIDHALECIKLYKEHLDIYWVSLPIALRNAVSNFQPKWTCWDKKEIPLWVRTPPEIAITDENFFPFFREDMEFEEFVPEFGKWYANGELCACFVGIRTDESLNRFRTIVSEDKITYEGKSFTTLTLDRVYNIYPIYDWKVGDIWTYHAKNPDKRFNLIYEYMYKAGLSPAQMRICQPYGDTQKQGLHLYHVLEPENWKRIVARVNGANSGALYSQESGSITGRGTIDKPSHLTWKEFSQLLLNSLPAPYKLHYSTKFDTFINWWKERGFQEGIPDEVDSKLEAEKSSPSWRRICKVLLKNDYWCKGLSFAQPKSDAYKKYLLEKRNSDNQ